MLKFKSEQVGEKIRRLRLKKGWSQGDLMIAAGIKQQQTVSNYETGKKKNPPLYMLQKIADALGVSVEDLLETHIECSAEDKPNLNFLVSNQANLLPDGDPLISNNELKFLLQSPEDLHVEQYLSILFQLRSYLKILTKQKKSLYQIEHENQAKNQER